MNHDRTRRLPGCMALAYLLFPLLGCETHQQPRTTVEQGPLNASYLIAGQPIHLVDGAGVAEAASGSAAKVVTRYFGNELRHDVDGDGREDLVFLLTQETGGSGTWFYVVAALDRPGGWIGSQGMPVGDRIAPQSIVPGPGTQVVVNYADRAPGEPFTAPPSRGRSLRLRFDPGTLSFGSIADDYPGAADPASMTLGMHRWTWTGFVDRDGDAWPAPHADAFTLRFYEDGRFDATTDCNRLAGGYTIDGQRLSFGSIASTRMHCEDSQEGLYTEMLDEVAGFEFTGRGQLVLFFGNPPGSMTFR